MFSKTPELYDAIYGTFKDYASESRVVADRLRAERPDVRRVLDVACGTAEHARCLVEQHGLRVDGVDIEPGFIALARRKLPGSRFEVADMADFDLGERYQAVLCLFSSIGYVRTTDRLTEALTCFHAHLEDDGVLLLEPWFAPGAWHAGRVYVHTSEHDGLHVARMSHSSVHGRLSRLRFEYLIGTDQGIRREAEDHELALFTRAEMEVGLARAGFTEVSYDPEGLTGRGLYVARRSGSPRRHP